MGVEYQLVTLASRGRAGGDPLVVKTAFSASTFSCDVAYSSSPAASRASAWLRKSRERKTFRLER